MLGAYTVVAAAGLGLPFWLGVLLAPLVVGAVGLAIEGLLIRHVYRRPLDTILATWGLSIAIKQAMYFKDQNPEIETTVLFSDLRTPGAGGENFYRSGQNKGVTFRKGVASEVVDGSNPTVKFKDLILDEDISEEVDMVVLATGLQPPDSARHFENLLDLNLNEYGFCETDKFSPLQTTHSGVFVCGAFSSPKEISETILDASGAAAEVMRLLKLEASRVTPVSFVLPRRNAEFAFQDDVFVPCHDHLHLGRHAGLEDLRRGQRHNRVVLYNVARPPTGRPGNRSHRRNRTFKRPVWQRNSGC